VKRVTLLALVLGAGCAEVAGLGDFERATGAGAEGAGAAGDGGGEAGAGGGAGTGGAPPCNTDDLVLSEIRTQGSAGARDDLIEIYNPTSNAIDLQGYTVTARAPTSDPGSDMPRFTGDAGQTIPAFGHLLVGGELFDDGAVPDETLSSGASIGSDVLVFLNKDGRRLDVVCICADSCSDILWSECADVLLENPAGLVDEDISVHRVPACVDTDEPVDFAAGPSSPMSTTSPPTPP
jgi:hypothetical protein